jgi:hypothetical protein
MMNVSYTTPQPSCTSVPRTGAGILLGHVAVNEEGEWQVPGCSVDGVTEFGGLVGAIRDGRHAIDYRDFERRLKLGVLWEWEDIAWRISEGLLTAEALDEAIHQGMPSVPP